MNMKGKGTYQNGLKRKSRTKLLFYLRDGKWHRRREIKKNMKVSVATLNKELKELTEAHFLEKKVDFESGEYPYPASYRIGERAKFLVDFSMKLYDAYDELLQFLSETKDKKEYVNAMTEFFHNSCLSMLKYKKKQKDLKIDDIAWMTLMFIEPLESIVGVFMERF